MTDTSGVSIPEEDFDYGDYDLEQDVVVTPATQALDYPDQDVQDDGNGEDTETRGFVSRVGRTPAEAIAVARSWCRSRHWCGVGMCLATVRQYYNVPSGTPTASASYYQSAHKRGVRSGRDVPRGAPVYWTGGSRGAGHIAISVGGGVCLSTDWKEAGRIDYAHIDDITSHWGLDFRGYTFEVNGVQVWAPDTSASRPTVSLKNLKPGEKNSDVLQLKKRLKEKGYGRLFMLSSNKFGKGTKRAYAKYQRHLGFSGSDANGIPGRVSLRKLGFKVL